MTRLGYVPVTALDPEQQAEVMAKMAKEQMEWRRANGFIPVPPPMVEPGRLFCGHLTAAIVREFDGTEWCGKCGESPVVVP